MPTTAMAISRSVAKSGSLLRGSFIGHYHEDTIAAGTDADRVVWSPLCGAGGRLLRMVGRGPSLLQKGCAINMTQPLWLPAWGGP